MIYYSIYYLVPGPITDHKIVNYRGVTIKWNPPINSNGKLVKYLVEWTVNNNTHSADVSISNDKNENGYTHVFKVSGIDVVCVCMCVCVRVSLK